ncbi:MULTISPECIES: hydrogen peroxide-inducible genes activator [unclassified Shinella]|jgi:LysR family hydrogen peroxide-inducible transcriptional activator|uniref:hydrogen peroxide-inducible genes activator n=1 Tax=unclassified Shinella TaxID=2643062 RepID=UPI0003C54EC5|nr:MULTISPECIES: hydrogen peroxide-inducible genes activator [unclassified Shinella]MCA0344411.1 hydrogen peroxide-inducible genes activator [Pseudomonadota bacterium]EYR77828.1 hydrogen peroxide-inducible activator [Shinella sp. DD12]KNY17933.1 LysR family transcriptional regulator [Shinella sp. SUS2]KOC75673.1 LysR family transcriptional regulator [Shinella sp. GWS1]MCO5149618.1 hydrogen peroxide-inducible genes activator [Shinella sp.]
MNGLTMKHLRYFEALARIGHFGRAAESCAISQPALSVQIRELEDLVGVPLVERGGRRIRLTGLGEEFAERTRAILRSVDELEDLGRAAHGPIAGRLRLGVIPTVAPYLLPDIIKALATLYPGIDPRPREAITQRLIEDLTEAKLDAAIVALPISEPALKEIALFDEEFVLVRPLEDAGKPVPSSDRLHEMRLLLLEEGHCFRDQALSVCNIGASSVRDLMEGSSLSTLVQMVGAGIGVTLIPQMAVDTETRSASVCISSLAEPRPTRTIGMVWRKSNPLSAQFATIAEIVRDAGLKKQG